MDDYEIGKRLDEILRADLARGVLAPLAEYQRLYPGHEDRIAREYAAIVGGRSGPGAAGLASLDFLPARERGHYTRLGEIARGGMGAILHVRDETLGRDLAMKIVLQEAEEPDASSPAAQGPLARRFLEEARITARLDHPGVVPVHELGADETGRPFFTMKLIQGGTTLAEVFRRSRAGDPAFPRRLVVRILVRVLETLAFAHEKGIVHRDLKPANVMVGNFGEVYVMDWGLAKVAGAPDGEARPTGERDAGASSAALTQVGQVLGTPAYMPVEQARGEGIDARADLYAVGAMLYEFLAGVHPYGAVDEARSSVEILVRLLAGPPPDLGGLAPEAPPELVSIVEKAMARDKAARYATAMEFARDLQNFAEGKVVFAHETGAWAELRKWIGRNRALSGAVATAVLLLLAGLGTATALGLKADEEREVARRLAFRAAIGAAVAHLANQDMEAVRVRLAQVPEDLRGWEWRHLASRMEESLLTLEGTGMALSAEGRLRVVDLAGVVREYDPDGGTSRVLATIDRAGVQAWVTKDGGHVCTVRERADQRFRHDVRFVPVDGATPERTVVADIESERWDRGSRMPWFVYSGTDRRLHVLDVTTGLDRTPACLADQGDAVFTRSSADGRFLLLEKQDEVVLVDLAEDRLRLTLRHARDAKPICAAVAEGAGRVALGTEDGVVEIRDLSTGDLAGPGRFPAHAGPLQFVAFDAAGRLLATGGLDRTVRIFDAGTGAPIDTLQGHRKALEEGGFTADGGLLVTRATGSEIRVWAVHRTDPAVLRGHASYVYCVAFSPDGERLYSGGWDGFVDRGGALRVWDVATGEEIAAWGDAERGLCVFTLALTRDGRRVVTLGGERQGFQTGSIRVWDAGTGRLLKEHPGAWRTLALHPDGRHAVVAEFLPDVAAGEVYVLVDLASGAVRRRFLRKPVAWAAYNVDPAFRPDGSLLATPSADASAVLLWDAEAGREVERIPLPGGSVTSLCFSPDGARLLATTDDDSWHVWDVATSRRLGGQSGTGNEVLAGAFSPGGRTILTGGRDRTLRLWDARTFEEIVRLPGHADYIRAVAASPDGQVLASGSGDHTVRLWHARTAVEVHRAQVLRRDLVAGLAPKVAARFAGLGDPAAVVLRLERESEGRAREVALQLALAESVARARAAAGAPPRDD